MICRYKKKEIEYKKPLFGSGFFADETSGKKCKKQKMCRKLCIVAVFFDCNRGEVCNMKRDLPQ